METIFMNNENSKTNEPNKFVYQFIDNNRFKILAPSWNEEFDFPDGSYLISDIQDYFQYVIKKDNTIADNSPVQIYVNKTKNRIFFQIRTDYKLELLSPETMKLLGSAKKDVDKDKDGENAPKLESVEVALLHCNLVSNSYQQACKVLFIFLPNKQFGQLITISPQPLAAQKTTKAEFQSIKLWFTDQNNRPLEIGDSVNITLIIGQTL